MAATKTRSTKSSSQPALSTGILSELAAPAPGVTEIYCHPATSDDWPGAVPGARYTDELAALTDPRVIAALAASGAASGPFARVNCDAAEAGTAPAANPVSYTQNRAHET